MNSEAKVRVDRSRDFAAIRQSLKDAIQFKTPIALVAKGDALELMRKLPDKSVSLVLTDPPYHATKKDNIYGDTAFEKDEHYMAWMEEVADEWRRILRPNGTLYCFCSPRLGARLEVMFSRHFNVLAEITWTKPNDPGYDGWKQKMNKEALRGWYCHSERIICAEPAVPGNLRRSPLGMFLREKRQEAGLSTYDVAEAIGAYGTVNHGGAVSNWEAGRNVPSREQYEGMCRTFMRTRKVDQMPNYEDIVRPFLVDATVEFTDTWSFPSVRPFPGKHPAEKPVELLEHAIAASSYPGDIVLDCFAGSGSTAVAAVRQGRLVAAVEIESRWCESAAARLSVELEQGGRKSAARGRATAPANQIALFGGK